MYFSITMETQKRYEPDNTAVRTALWRAMHVQIDAKPHILEDEVGLQLIAPDTDWRQRIDMHPKATQRLRAAMVGRARFIEDIISEESKKGITQYVLLGAGLDTFAQRRKDIASHLQIFEIDQPDTQAWKQGRLNELGFGIPDNLHFVSVNFETASWWEELLKSGFDLSKPAFVACTGVTLYLSKEAIAEMIFRMSQLAPDSRLAIAFYLPIELLDEEDKFLQQMADKSLREAGTPFVSFLSAPEVMVLAEKFSLKDAQIVTTKAIEQLYFSDRTDNLLPASGEMFLVARV